MTTRTPQQIATMKAWQQKLVDAAVKDGVPNPLPKYGADGTGGQETLDAILAYQKRHGLTATGQFDAPTRNALAPHVTVSPLEIAILTGIISNLPGIPPALKEIITMFNIPTLVQQLVGIIPGIPDDFNTVVAELQEAASGDLAVAKIRSAALFSRRFADAADQVANALDPTGKIQPSVPLPPPMPSK